MKPVSLTLGALLVFAFVTPVLTQDLGVDLQVAKQREAGQGCQSTVPEYERIARQGAKTDRATAAEALLRVAMCLERAGDSQAKKLYARLVSEFSDVPAVALQAERRLKPTDGPGPATPQSQSRHLAFTLDRSVYAYGRLSDDGRYLPFSAKVQGADQLFVRDVTTGASRQVTSTPPGGRGAFPWDSAAAHSKDGRWLAYGWDKAGNSNGAYEQELRIVDLQAPGSPEPRTVYVARHGEMLYPHDWTPDHASIAMEILGPDSLLVGVLSVKEGSFRLLRSLKPDARPGNGQSVFLSPDGKYAAFDYLSAGKPGRDIVAIDLVTNADVMTISHSADDALLGWSPEGDLVFESDRSGSWSLMTTEVGPGAVPAARSLARNMNPIDISLGITRAGEIWSLTKGRGSAEVMLASIDLSAGNVIRAPQEVATEHLGTNDLPSWSRDGLYLAYLSNRGTVYLPRRIVVVRSMSTGEVREVRPSLTTRPNMPAPVWSADGASLILSGEGSSGPGIYRVDWRTSDTTFIVGGRVAPGPSAENVRLACGTRSLSPDGKTLIYRRGGPSNASFVERALATGEERLVWQGTEVDCSSDGSFLYGVRAAANAPAVIVQTNLRTGVTREIPAPVGATQAWVSPDGQKMFVGGQNSAHIVSLGTGEPLQIGSQSMRFLAWTLDSKVVVLATGGEVWWTPIDGSPRRKLEGVKPGEGVARFEIHPDGRRTAQTYTSPPGLDEVWVLRGMLPATKR